MPVYNAEQFLQESIESILNQMFDDFEFIIVNDCSTDKSPIIINSYNDKRIKIINNSKNIGCANSRNIGINVSKGKYICAMDADDISLPHRLEKQFLFMEKNIEFGMAGSGIEYFGNRNINLFRLSNPEIIKIFLLYHSYLPHPTFIIRNQLIQKYSLFYDNEFGYAEDYGLQSIVSRYFPITVIPEILVKYRCHQNQISNFKNEQQDQNADKVRLYQLDNFQIKPTEEEKLIHLQLTKRIPNSNINISKLEFWAKKLLEINQKHKYYNQTLLELSFQNAINQQIYCEESNIINEFSYNFNNSKIELLNAIFILPFKIDKIFTDNNVNKIIKYLINNIKAKIILLEFGDYVAYNNLYNLEYHLISEFDFTIKENFIENFLLLHPTSYKCIWYSNINITLTENFEKCKLDFPVVELNQLDLLNENLNCFNSMFVKKTLNTIFYTIKIKDLNLVNF